MLIFSCCCLLLLLLLEIIAGNMLNEGGLQRPAQKMLLNFTCCCEKSVVDCSCQTWPLMSVTRCVCCLYAVVVMHVFVVLHFVSHCWHLLALCELNKIFG